MAQAQTLRKVMSRPLAPNFHASQWQHRPAWQNTWHALETSFGRGESFLHSLQAWQQDANAPAMLFFTAFANESPTQLEPLIAGHLFGLLPGVHRIALENNKVQLTLCIGTASVMAREIDIAADSVLTTSLEEWDARSIARLCRRGTALAWSTLPAHVLQALQQQGVQVNDPSQGGVYLPQWTPKTSLRPSVSDPLNQTQADANRHAVVIGAGLSGSAVAYSLATRGWTVEVLDQAKNPAAGASGLPAGIFATHVSPDNNVLSRITRDGVRATMQRARQLQLQGSHWQVSELLEHRYAGKRKLPTGDLWPDAGHEWSTDASTPQKLAGGLQANSDAVWHAKAGWIQTPEFVKAQLSHPNIIWRGQCNVAQLQRIHSEWQALDAQGKCLAASQHMVLANAHQCQVLLDTVQCHERGNIHKRPLLPATALRGQVTLGSMAMLPPRLKAQLPSFPVNGHGSYIGHLQDLQNPCADAEGYWIVGSSFQRHEVDTTTRPEDEASNIQQWAELMPALSDEIQQGIALTQTRSWAGVRSALPDRVPAVGEFEHPDFKGLHVCTGMGARGISWSVLCGELLAAHINHEPLPMAASLAKRMAASRFG